MAHPDGHVRTMIEKLEAKAEEEGGKMFMGWPERWWDGGKFRCENGHVSTTILKAEALGRDACLACHGRLTLTFPEDEDGALED